MLNDIPVYPSEDWGYVFATVLTGFIVVFFVLIILILLIKLMGIAFNRAKKQKEQHHDDIAVEFRSSAFPTGVPAATVDENETIAVIAAAIYAIGDSDGKKYEIKNIKRRDIQKRTGWGSAGVRESMNRFEK
jgi:sodium pump decarboxylase gamma subunit